MVKPEDHTEFAQTMFNSERVQQYIQRADTGCWNWTGPLSQRGYALMRSTAQSTASIALQSSHNSDVTSRTRCRSPVPESQVRQSSAP